MTGSILVLQPLLLIPCVEVPRITLLRSNPLNKTVLYKSHAWAFCWDGVLLSSSVVGCFSWFGDI